jgi:signal transduction histidine kinase
MQPDRSALLEIALERLGAAVALYSVEEGLLWEDERCEQLLGIRLHDISEEEFIARCHADDAAAGSTVVFSGDAEVRWWVNDQWRRIRIAQTGQYEGSYVVLLTDVTAVRELVERAAVLQSMFDASVELARDGSVVRDTLSLSTSDREAFAQALTTLGDTGLVPAGGTVWQARVGRLNTGSVVALFDMSDADRSLRRDALWRRVVESLAEGLWLLDDAGIVIECNSTSLAMVSKTREEALGEPFSKVAPALAMVRQAHGSVTITRSDREIHLECARSSFPLADGTLGEALIVRDVSKESELAGALSLERRTLSELNEELRAVVAAIANARGRERAAIARRIHDDPIQRLAALRWRLSGADPMAAADLESCYEALRAVVFDLRPQALLDRGLVAALREMEELDERVVVSASGVDDVHADIADLVWRNVREAVRNAITHSGGTSIEVAVAKSGEMVICEVRDNGCGVTPELLRSAERRGHVGVASIRETVAETGGKFYVIGLNTGTTVRMEVPGRWATS